MIAAAAYRAGEKLYDGETGLNHDFTRKGGVVHQEILLPDHAPKEYLDRQRLWESVTKVEKKSNAQLAREVEIALPVEFSRELQLAVIKEYVQTNFVSKGMCVDIAIHDKKNGNPHAHILLTTRPIKADGSWGTKEKKEYARDENGNRKLAKANRMMAEYQTAVAKEAAQIKREMQMELREKADKVICRQSRQLSGMTVVLLIAYLIQLTAFLFLEKDVVATIPLWFRNRYRNVQWQELLLWECQFQW